MKVGFICLINEFYVYINISIGSFFFKNCTLVFNQSYLFFDNKNLIESINQIYLKQK